MFRGTVFGFCLPMKNCSCLSINSHGFGKGRSNRYRKSSGLAPITFIGRGWTLIYRCNPFETHPHFRWFLPQRANSLLGADTQPKPAALGHGLRAGQRQR